MGLAVPGLLLLGPGLASLSLAWASNSTKVSLSSLWLISSLWLLSFQLSSLVLFIGLELLLLLLVVLGLRFLLLLLHPFTTCLKLKVDLISSLTRSSVCWRGGRLSDPLP